MNNDINDIRKELEQETTMSFEKQTGKPDDISAEVLHVINALKHPDSSQQMLESKDTIYHRFLQKTNNLSQSTTRRNGKKISFRLLAVVASVTLLLVAATGFLTYSLGYESGSNQMADTYVETTAPNGTISRIKLIDGSTVILNGGSKLIYPSAFTTKREVILSGEGFFDITPNENKPFIVQTRNLSVKVLGTRFGMKAYEEESQTTLTLESGSVSALPRDKRKAETILLEADQLLTMDNETKKIRRQLIDAKEHNAWKNSILLEPNQQLTLNNQSGELERKNVDANDYLSWKDGIFNFRNSTLEEIAVIMERRFDIKILIQSEDLKKERYHALFKYGENPNVIFDKLSLKRSWRYIQNEGVYEIVKTNNRP